MKLWEYNNVIVQGDISQAIPTLDEAGGDGWEFAGFAQDTDYGVVYLMKRELQINPIKSPIMAQEAVKHNHSFRFMCTDDCPYYGTPNEINP